MNEDDHVSSAAAPSPAAGSIDGNHHPPANSNNRVWLAIVPLAVLVLFAILLFARLGCYALWDDEADVALFARNLWHSGDLLAWDGTNLVAYREGVSLLGMKNRLMPPLQYIVAAPFIGLLGENALAARLPFALVALSGFAVWWRWLKREKASWLVQLSTAIAITGNVSLFLYSRQARHYSLSWVLCIAVAYCYVHRRDSLRLRLFLVLGSGLLLSSHYLSYGGLMVCVGIDYLLFEFRKKSDSWLERVVFVGAQLIFLAVLVFGYGLQARAVTPYVPVNWFLDKVTLFWWNLRDLNSCEFLWLPILPLALVVFALQRAKDLWLARAVLAMVIYASVVAILSPQPVGGSQVADIRYMAPTIPLGLFITVRTVTQIPALPRAGTIALVAFLSFTTVPHALTQRALMGASAELQVAAVPYRSTFLAFLGELSVPQRSAYREAANWLNSHLDSGTFIDVRPDYAVYPLQFHSPQHRFISLLRRDQRSEYPTLPDYVFKGQRVPDVVVAFGRDVEVVRRKLARLKRRGVLFAPPVALGVAGPDRTRPELFWRTFATTPLANPDSDGTYIFRRIQQPTAE